MGDLESYVASTSTYRSVIAAELRRRHDEDVAKQLHETQRRDTQRDRTRSLVRLMHLDTRDEAKIALHAENATHYNQRAAVLDQIRALQSRYQAEKKRLPAIQDKKERHERLQRAKEARDKDVTALRQHLALLEAAAPAVVRPGSSLYAGNVDRAATPAGVESLPDVTVQKPSRRSERISATVYKQLMDQIRAIKKDRPTMLDPYMANLKLARLWDRLHDTARCLENYDAACQMMKEKHLAQIPPEILEETLEKQRLRRRAALHYLFSRALQRKQRQEAANLLSRFIELSLPQDRLKDLAYVDRILREQEYIEDPTLASPDEITFTIRSTNSLGHLTDLRFKLLKELLAAAPTDPYLIESVANIHVRRGEFAAAEELTARFVALPPVKRISLFATFNELRCGV
ncbi:hypothetical protein PF005_g5397 [Phytophthora fragariae]|uniref:Uncharacterized protein n=1 Tax=Phytophthora fragariae TaxID=53985 RepID=A0A6A3FJ97_9STRA|nr:hypothetical protein PF003_g3649 [Phytophthora fragariae]KAE8944080.1 hypothetical protein PF009_g6227 [Phytophthora fragariae]KAE9126686.1 hypothetical protein PF007_g5886 [Phytophthora fragariae]KAE9128319.1 hypothetical protein PF010_g4560 [Phytophthora fragariae]KAE9150805.1 hypothetical protein PF006_g4846 [Phytophthora fragariae]